MTDPLTSPTNTEASTTTTDAQPSTTTNTTTTTNNPSPPRHLSLLKTLHPTPSTTTASSSSSSKDSPTPPGLSPGPRAWQSSPHPTQPLLATAYADKVVRIYSLVSGLCVSTISGGHKRSVRCVGWKPDFRGAEGGGTGGGGLRVYGEEGVENGDGMREDATRESVLATGSFDASVGIWRGGGRGEADASGLTEEQKAAPADTANADEEDENEDEDGWTFALVLEGHESEIKSVAWSAAGNLLATCSRDKSVWIWEEVAEDEYETVAVLQEHEGDVKCVCWHPVEEMVASASYDDEVRLWRDEGDDWGCVWRSGGGDAEGQGQGHKGTVWGVAWEGVEARLAGSTPGLGDEEGRRKSWMQRRQKAGPRLISCSDDTTVKIWRRVPREKRRPQNSLSILRTGDFGEDWVEEATLPRVHERSVYAIAWSAVTGRVVSVGGDGRVVVYEEALGAEVNGEGVVDAVGEGEEGQKASQIEDESIEDTKAADAATATASTTWSIIAIQEAAHGVFEINHVAWAHKPRCGDGVEGGEVIVTTGDDGAVGVWEVG